MGPGGQQSSMHAHRRGVQVWAKALEGYGGRVRYLTNSELSTLGTESPGQTGYVAYQALDEPPNRVNDANLQEKFAEDIAAIGLTNVDIVLEKVS